MNDELIKELETRMKEIKAIKAELWNQGKFDPLMEAEYWDCQMVMRQTQQGEGVDVSDILQKKHDGVIAAQQQIHKAAES